MPDQPEPAADAFDISLAAARAHGCCSAWRPPGGRPTAEIIELAKARPPAGAGTEDKHDDSTR
jgi:hypothetical protein